MMKKALIIMSSHIGHYNSTYHLAKDLKDIGYRVIYIGDNSLKDNIEKMGFEYEYFNFIQCFFDRRYFDIRLFWKNLCDFFSDNYLTKRYETFKAQCFILQKVVQRYNPDILFIDTFLYAHPIILHEYREKIMLLETMLSRSYDCLTPPLNCSLKSFDHKLLNRLYIKMQWNIHFFNLRVNRAIQNILYLNQAKHRLLFKYLKSQNILPCNIIDSKRSFFFTIRGCKEIILSPEGLDFPWRRKTETQFFYSKPRELYREDLNLNDPFFKTLEVIKSLKEKNNAKIVYCSLGTVSSIHANKPQQFLNRIIKAFENDKEWILIIAGDHNLDSSIGDSDNIFRFPIVPQIEVLKISDLFITHGGLNSIIESILTSTPMLIYPLNKRWDQIGNADRMHYHKIGILGNIKRDSSAIIKMHSDVIINNKTYLNYLQRIKSIFQSNEGSLNKLISFIASSSQ